jgi:uncharacterized Zn-binding protein involved in type VI secretion
MPASARLKDFCTGHGCFPPRPNNQASTDVSINGRGAHREGDSWERHSCGRGKGHSAQTLNKPSKTVFVNGKGLGNIGTAVDCGSTILTGSHNVSNDN